jgi:hypothetical protein
MADCGGYDQSGYGDKPEYSRCNHAGLDKEGCQSSRMQSGPSPTLKPLHAGGRCPHFGGLFNLMIGFAQNLNVASVPNKNTEFVSSPLVAFDATHVSYTVTLASPFVSVTARSFA